MIIVFLSPSRVACHDVIFIDEFALVVGWLQTVDPRN